MKDKLKEKVRSKADGLRQKTGRLINDPRGVRGLPGNDAVKLAVKGAAAAAAVAAVLMMIIAGADLRPSAVMEGIKDKQLFAHASGEGFPVDISGSRIIKIGCVTKGTAVLTDTTYTIYDRKGRSVISDNHRLSSPSMVTAGHYALLFDRMGMDFTVRTLSGVRCKGSTEASIICADICSSGRFVLVTQSETTNGLVIVYSPDGREEYRWKSVDNKIADVSISPSGRYIALSGVSAQNGTLVSTVIVQKVGAKKNVREFTLEDTLVIDIAFIDNARIAAVGDDSAAYFDINSGKTDLYPYNDRTLNCYDFSENGDMALVFSQNSDGRNSSVTVIDRNCQEKASIATAMTSPYVSLKDGRIHLLSKNVVSSYHYSGKLIRTAEVPADCHEIFFSQGKLLANGVMYIKEVE